MTAMRVVVILSVLLPLAAADGIPNITPHIVYPGEQSTARNWVLAPHILVVRVLRLDPKGPAVQVVAPTPQYSGISMRLVEVTARVENVISGKAEPNELKFYYYFASSVVAGGGQDFNPGSRYIVFLREEAGALRTVTDLTSSALLVVSGAHEQSELPLVSPSPRTSGEWRDPATGGAIAYVLFTPGKDYDARSFSDKLENTVDEFRRLLPVPTGYVVSLLRALRKRPEQRVRREACAVLLGQYRVQDSCIDDLRGAPELEAQKLGAHLLAKARAGEAQLLLDLAEDPLNVAIPSGDSRDFASALTRFALDQRPRIRRRACEILQALYTTEKFHECGDGGNMRQH